jgi:hypothetical protein
MSRLSNKYGSYKNSELRTIHAMSEPMATDYSQVPIIQCAYQLSLEMHRLVGGFPKQLRFRRGRRRADR